MSDSTDEKLDALAKHIDGLHRKIDAESEERKADRKRLDAMDEWRAKSDAAEKEREDKARKDAAEREEKEREDKARKDAAEKEREDREREDKARKDAAEKEAKEKEEKEKNDRARNDSLAAEIAALKAAMPARHAPEDKNKFAAAQMRADAAYQAWGLGQAPPALLGESLRDYRLRLAAPLKQYSRNFKDSALETIGDEGAFSTVETSIINDAVAASTSTVTQGAPLRMITEKNESGHTVRKFYGDPAVTWGPFMGGAIRIAKLQRPTAAK
jgi:colicin import membrane protein